MAGLVPAIYVFKHEQQERRGCPRHLARRRASRFCAGTMRKRIPPMKSGLFDLSGKVAIVTGGNGGIGLGMARGLAAAGAAVAVVGRNEAKSKAAVAELTQAGAKAISVTTAV